MNQWLKALLLTAAICWTLVPEAHAADTPQVLIGTWKRVASKDPDGRTLQPPAPAAFLLFTADGHFAQIATVAGRPKQDKPVSTLTREELLERFGQTEALYGTYELDGNVLTRRTLSHINPSHEGASIKQVFRIEGDTLVLTMARPAARFEATFQRVR